LQLGNRPEYTDALRSCLQDTETFSFCGAGNCKAVVMQLGREINLKNVTMTCS